ncbi:MAG: hypothetical protein PW843_17280 [Azospirillaceae bacterium]|nr:hypothetical protein [Azospirillaceae bacterium]
MKRHATLLFLAISTPALADADARVEVPVTLTVLPDGAPRYSVPVTVDGREVQAMLDSGSFGLHLLAGPDGAGEGVPMQAAYGSGVQLLGPMRAASVMLGGLTASMPVQWVGHVGCVAARPDCPARALSQADYRIGGDGFPQVGFVAIIGVSLPQPGGHPPLPNPLTLLAHRWVIDVPRAGRIMGRLVLNPTEDEVASYVRFPLDPAMRGRGGGMNDAVPGCIAVGDGAPVCAPVVVDSGAVGVMPLGHAALRGQGDSGPAVLTIGSGAGVVRLPYAAGADAASRTDLSGADGAPGILTGVLAYQHAAVLYDADKAEIGFKPDATP